MYKFIINIFSMVALLVTSSFVFGVENCHLKNRGSFSAEVRVFDESNGNKLWEGTLDRNERIRLTPQGNRIRYEYYYLPHEDSYHSNTGANCQDYREIAL